MDVACALWEARVLLALETVVSKLPLALFSMRVLPCDAHKAVVIFIEQGTTGAPTASQQPDDLHLCCKQKNVQPVLQYSYT